MPTNKTTISNVEQKDGGENESSSDNNLATMWKFMTVSRRVQAAEEAVEKVMGILNEVLQDISHLKNMRTDLERLREDHLKMEREFDTVKSGALQTNLENASEYVKQFESLDTFAFKKDLAQFVTWSALERALTKKEVQGGRIGDTTDETMRDENSIERPGTAPVPSNTIWEKVDEPPRTAMSPREFQKVHLWLFYFILFNFVLVTISIRDKLQGLECRNS